MSELAADDVDGKAVIEVVEQCKGPTSLDSKKEMVNELELESESGEIDADSQSSEITRLRDVVTVLSNKCEELQREKAELGEELEKTKLSLQAESEALANKTDDSKELETLQLHLKKLEQDIANMTLERDSLESNLEELDSQHQLAVEQLIHSRDILSTQCKELVAQNESLKSKLEGASEQNTNGDALEIFWRILHEAEIVDAEDETENTFEGGVNVLRRLAESRNEAKTCCEDLMEKVKYLQVIEEDCKKLLSENQHLLSDKSSLESELRHSVSEGVKHSSRTVLQEQITELQSMIGGLENQVREKEHQVESLKDILKVYKENLDPELETAKNRELELQKKLEAQIKNEELEKARMMSVLNDKVRENSSLKAEVHRLVNVVSAERAALAKVQRDCEQLAATKRDTLSGHGEDELTKQAVHNLSRLVSDRDLEIQALKEKNQTLTTLIQEGSSDPNSTTVRAMLSELEELRKKVAQYQAEHEQIIPLLTQKHNESVAYHGEMMKLNVMMQEEKRKSDVLHEQNDDLSKKLDEKQMAYLSAQNEAVALQGRVLQLEQQQENLQLRYNRLLQEENRIENVPGTEIDEPAEMATVRVDREEWTAKLQELDKCRQMMQDRDRMLYEKDCLVHEKMRQIENSKDLFQRKEEELSMACQRHNHLSSQLEGSRGEARTAREQNAALRSKLEDHRSEIALLKETNSALSVTLQEREFELKALRGKVETLSRLVEQQRSLNNSSREEEEKNNIRKLLSDSEEMRQRAQGFQAERDQTLLALNHKQRENEFIQEQLKTMKEREERLIRELERLRSHLLQVEESYTQEAIRSEEREKELRTRLALAEDRIHMATSNHSMASQHASLQVESLQEQIRSVMEQRDSSLNKCSNLEDQIAQKSAALRTLQVVLEQLQEEKRRDIANYQNQCEAALRLQREECLRLNVELEALQSELQDAKEALGAASRLTEQLDRKEDTILMLKEHVEFQEAALEKAKAQIELMRSSSDITVDKTIVKNLVVGYITVPHGQQREVLRVIATVLDFSKDEREKTGLDELRSSWISWLSGKPPPSPIRSHPIIQQSLTEAFVRFLESESQPRPKIKLSIEALTSARESRPKRANQITSSTSGETSNVNAGSTNTLNSNSLQNPFVVSLMPSLSDAYSLPVKSESSSNLLMKPMSTALPTFVPLADRSSTNDILRDVLK